MKIISRREAINGALAAGASVLSFGGSGLAQMNQNQQRQEEQTGWDENEDDFVVFIDFRKESKNYYQTRYMKAGEWRIQAIDPNDPKKPDVPKLPVAWSPYEKVVYNQSGSVHAGWLAGCHCFYTYAPFGGSGVEHFTRGIKDAATPELAIAMAQPNPLVLEKNAMVTFWLSTSYLKWATGKILGGGLSFSVKRISS